MKKKVKWFNNSIKEIQISEDEPIPEGFVKGRLPKPKKIDSLVLKASKEVLFEKYILQNMPFKDLSAEFNITDKDARILLSHYKIKKDPMQARKNNNYTRTHEQSVEIGKKSRATQQRKWENKSVEEKEAWSNKCKEAQAKVSAETKKKKTEEYLTWWYGLSDQERAEINTKRKNSCKKAWQDYGDDIQARKKKTEKENRKNRLCRSVAEQKLFDVLIKCYQDTIYDIRVDDRYPYYVDFYIPSEDLFIELNAHPSHGRLPISKLSVEEYSKYPQKWLDVFARRDVEKQQCALKNKLNYIMIYPSATLEENKMINNNHELIELLYNSQL